MIKGFLKFMSDSNRWAVVAPDRDHPVDITSGDAFEIETPHGMKQTRMEHVHGKGYCSIDNYALKDGLKVVLGGRGGLI